MSHNISKPVSQLPFSLPDEHVPDSLERFVSRVLRREVFNALAEQGQAASDPYQLVLYGSASVQVHRPLPGYPIRRTARDIDVGFIAQEGNRDHDPEKEVRHTLGARIREAVLASGATIVEGSEKGIAGFDGFKIQKTYSTADIAERVHGRLEEQDVQHRLAKVETLTTSIAVEKLVMRSPLLPPLPLGDKGFLVTDIRETVGEKIARLVSAKPVVRDMIDVYNVFHASTPTSLPVINLEDNKHLIRTIAVAQIAVNGMYANTQFVNGSPEAVEEIFDKLFARSAEQLDHLAPDERKARIQQAEVMSQNVACEVAKTHHALFPLSIERGDEFNESMRTPLNLTDDEIRFMLNVRGIDKPSDTPSFYREQVTATITPRYIVPEDVQQAHPTLMHALQHKHELVALVEHSRSRGI